MIKRQLGNRSTGGPQHYPYFTFFFKGRITLTGKWRKPYCDELTYSLFPCDMIQKLKNSSNVFIPNF